MRKLLFLSLAWLALLLLGCSKEDLRFQYRERGENFFPFPQISLEVQKLAFDKASAQSKLFNVDQLEIDKVGHCYGVGVVPDLFENCSEYSWSVGDSSFTSEFKLPFLDSVYLIRPYVILTNGKIIYGETKDFFTKGFILTTSRFARLLNNGRAEVSGFFEKLDTEIPIESHGHVWSPAPFINSLSDGDTTNLGKYEGGGAFSSLLTGLESDRKYYVRSYAIIDQNVYFGNTTSFTLGGWNRLNESGNAPPPRSLSAGFAIGDKVYVGGGFFYGGDLNDFFDPNLENDILKIFQIASQITVRSDFWEYDLTEQVWTRKRDIPGDPRVGAIAFAHEGYGYMGMGWNLDGIFQKTPNDLYRYDPASDTWEQIAVPGNIRGRMGAITFVIDNDVYIGGGGGAISSGLGTEGLNDFYKFTPGAGAWERKRDFGGGSRIFPVSFALDNKGYAGLGDTLSGNGIFLNFDAGNDFWSYDPQTDQWTEKTAFPGGSRTFSYGFQIGNKGYVGSGVREIEIRYDDHWEYNPNIDIWLKRTEEGFPLGERAFGLGLSNGSTGFFGFGISEQGQDAIVWERDWWEYVFPD